MNSYPKYIITAFVFCLLALSVNAQKGVKLGDKYAKKFDFINAIDQYKRALDKNANNLRAINGIASAYRHIGNFADSEEWYGKLVDLDSGNPEHRFHYSQALRSTKKYDKALQSWESYMASTNEDYVSDIIDGFDYMSSLAKPNPNIEIKNAVNLNTEASDFGVSFKNLAEITYCSTRSVSEGEQDNWTHEKFTDLYTSVVSFEDQSNPVKFSENQYNGIYHDGPATFFEEEMYLTRSQYNNAKTFKSKEDKTVNLELVTVDLYETSSKLKKFAEDFPFNDKEYSVGHATVSPDGKSIIFSSDSKVFGSYFGGTDLYLITRENGVWSAPMNLGAMINTPADEEYPFYSAQNEIHFASDGHYGLGGLDIYSSRFADQKWSEPENIGAPINSSADDFNYVFREESGFGFFSSNRAGGLGSDDIYSFRYKDGVNSPGNGGIMLKVLTYDAQTLEPLESVNLDISKCMDLQSQSSADGRGSMAVTPYTTCLLNANLDGYFPKEIPFSVFEKDLEISVPLRRVADNACELTVCVYDKKTKTALSNTSVKILSSVEGTFYTGTTDDNGCVSFKGILADNTYDIVATKEVTKPTQKYLATTVQVSTNGVECPAELQQDVYLDYVQLGVAYVIENIYYDLDKFFIRPDAAAELNHIVDVMRNNPTIEIELGSHTDCRNTAQYNQKLSDNRAKAAVEYIVSKGISASRLTWKGYGETKLVNYCACECDRPVSSIGLSSFRNCEDKQIPNCSDNQHQDNRRTEFTILKF